MDRYRIVIKTLYSGIENGEERYFETETPIWSGEELPPDEEQEIAFVASAVGPQEVPYDVEPNIVIKSHQPVLQERYSKLVSVAGRIITEFYYRNYSPEIDEDIDTYYAGLDIN
jgi:hypothetical protein